VLVRAVSRPLSGPQLRDGVSLRSTLFRPVASTAGQLTLGGRERRWVPLVHSRLLPGQVNALGELKARHAGRAVASLEPCTGITRATGPGSVEDSGSARLRLLPLSGVRSSVFRACLHTRVFRLGRPFVLTTPGG